MQTETSTVEQSTRRKSSKHWTKKENKELAKLISEHHYNITKACRIFSTKHPERTFAGTQQHWYEKLRHENTCFIVSNKRKVCINSKINGKPVSVTTPTGFAIIKEFFKSLFNMS